MIMRIVMMTMVIIISIIQFCNHCVPGQRDDEERDRLSNGWDLLLGGGPWALCWNGEGDYFYILKNIGEDDYFVEFGVCVDDVCQEYWNNPFFGWGDFFVTAEGLQTGPVFGTFIFLVPDFILFLIFIRFNYHHLQIMIIIIFIL